MKEYNFLEGKSVNKIVNKSVNKNIMKILLYTVYSITNNTVFVIIHIN